MYDSTTCTYTNIVKNESYLVMQCLVSMHMHVSTSVSSEPSKRFLHCTDQAVSMEEPFYGRQLRYWSVIMVPSIGHTLTVISTIELGHCLKDRLYITYDSCATACSACLTLERSTRVEAHMRMRGSVAVLDCIASPRPGSSNCLSQRCSMRKKSASSRRAHEYVEIFRLRAYIMPSPTLPTLSLSLSQFRIVSCLALVPSLK